MAVMPSDIAIKKIARMMDKLGAIIASNGNFNWFGA
jgi:hypothetical protein